MNGPVRMTIEAASRADLLCRLLGLLAQRNVAAPGMAVDISGQKMMVTIDLAAIPGQTAAILAEKMACCIGVEAITVDGVPLAYMTPTTLTPA